MSITIYQSIESYLLSQNAVYSLALNDIMACFADAELVQTVVLPPDQLPTGSTTLVTAAASGNLFLLSTSASIIGRCFLNG